jgi:hypothetical protein
MHTFDKNESARQHEREWWNEKASLLTMAAALVNTYSLGVAASRLDEESILAHKVLISANVKSLAQQSGDSP